MGGQGATGEPRGARFPLVVALVCTALAAVLFLTGTVPALREADDLRRTERRDRAELLELLGQSRQLAGRQRAVEWDPQAVLVELDRLGLTPEEILADNAPR